MYMQLIIWCKYMRRHMHHSKINHECFRRASKCNENNVKFGTHNVTYLIKGIKAIVLLTFTSVSLCQNQQSGNTSALSLTSLGEYNTPKKSVINFQNNYMPRCPFLLGQKKNVIYELSEQKQLCASQVYYMPQSIVQSSKVGKPLRKQDKFSNGGRI